MFGRFLASPVGSALRVFLGTVIGYAIVHLQAEGHVSWDEVWTWVAAAFAVAVPIVIAWVNPEDPRFGRVAP